MLHLQQSFAGPRFAPFPVPAFAARWSAIKTGRVCPHRPVGPDPRRADLDEIVRAAQRARDLTRQLLAFARKQTLTLKPVDLNQVVIGLCRMLERTLRENIDLQLGLAPHLGVVEGDTGQIEQVLLNLVLNAQDAMPDGGTLRIETAMCRKEESGADVPAGTYARLLVRDTGIGMDAETRGRIFEPFFTTKELGRGTGLGLSTVYGIVRQHGGWIDLDSAPGRGTAFHVYVPAKEVAGGGETAPDTESTTARTGNGCVLLVEDQAAVRSVTQRMLERDGYTVLAAGSGKEALALADSYPGTIRLLLSDVVMAGLSYRDLYRQLRDRRPGLRVLYISGYPAEEIGRHGVLDDGVVFLAKPFTPRELIRKIREVLG